MSSATPLANLTSLGGAEPIVVKFEFSVDGGEILFGELRTVDVKGIETSSSASRVEIVKTNTSLLETINVSRHGHGESRRVGVGGVLCLELLRNLGTSFFAENLLAGDPAVRVD